MAVAAFRQTRPQTVAQGECLEIDIKHTAASYGGNDIRRRRNCRENEDIQRPRLAAVVHDQPEGPPAQGPNME